MLSIRWAPGLRSVGFYLSSRSGLERIALHDYRLGQILDALFAANLNQVFGAVALRTLEVYAIPTPWLHQDTTTITLYGAYEEATRARRPRPPQSDSGPCPASSCLWAQQGWAR